MPVAVWDYLNNMGQGSNKTSMCVTYQTSARVPEGFKKEGTYSISQKENPDDLHSFAK